MPISMLAVLGRCGEGGKCIARTLSAIPVKGLAIRLT